MTWLEAAGGTGEGLGYSLRLCCDHHGAHVEALPVNEADASLGIKRCFFAPRILGAKLGAKSRPLQTA